MSNAAAAQWVKFFNASGIPSPAAAGYAHIFVENRIKNDMLMDLNKEYLREMGITPMGDIIAILRHAKSVNDQAAREKVLISSEICVPVAAVPAHPQLPSDKTSIDKKRVKKSLSGKSMNGNSDSTGNFKVKSSAAIVAPLPKQARRLQSDDEGKYKMKLASSVTERSKEIPAKQAKLYSEHDVTNSRSRVFERLAANTTRTVDLTSHNTDSNLNDSDSESSECDREIGDMRIQVSGIASKINFPTNSNVSSIFARLGGKADGGSDEALAASQIKPILKNRSKPESRSAIVKPKERPNKQNVILVKKVPLKRTESDEDDDNGLYDDDDVEMNDAFPSGSVSASEKVVKFASTAEVHEIVSSPNYRSPTNYKSRFRRQTTRNERFGSGIKSRLGSIQPLQGHKQSYNLKAANKNAFKHISPVKIKSLRMKSDELMLHQDLPVHTRLGKVRTEAASTSTNKSIYEISKRIGKVDLTTTTAPRRKQEKLCSNYKNTSVFDRLGFNS